MNEWYLRAINLAGESLFDASASRAVGESLEQLAQLDNDWRELLTQAQAEDCPVVRRGIVLLLRSGLQRGRGSNDQSSGT